MRPAPSPALPAFAQRPSRHARFAPHVRRRAALPDRLRERLRDRGAAGALPVGQSNPQKTPFGLYTEEINGTPFTAPRAQSRRTWTYRIRPSAVHKPFRPIDSRAAPQRAFDRGCRRTPNQLRWRPLPIPTSADGFRRRASSRSAATAIPRYRLGAGDAPVRRQRSMTDRFFYDADGELLIVPQHGALLVRTELGVLRRRARRDRVVPRGVKFRVELDDSEARGYVCENYGAHFRLPDLGPIGTNGLANSRDFLVAGRGLRGSRRRLSSSSRNSRAALWTAADRSLAARCRRVARQLRAVQVRPRALQRDRTRSATTIPTRRSSLRARVAERSRARRTSTS